MAAYYNEIDPFAAAWLRELIKAGHIADGEVDTRSIKDVRADDLRGFQQCHFFAGIGGWSLGLRLAGVADDAEVWTGSCPCQPFSSAARGKTKRTGCDKHLWPEFFRLITSRRPSLVVGEQVAGARDWLDVVCNDMEASNYTIWACILPAYCVAADHARERIYFAGHTNSDGKPRVPVNEKTPWLQGNYRFTDSVVLSDGFPSSVAYRAFGNAIVPQVAAEFVKAYLSI